MEIKAFILVQTEVGSEREVYSQLGNLNEVEQVYELFGEWDIIIRVKVDSIEQLDGFVSDIVRKTEGVTLTSTTLISR